MSVSKGTMNQVTLVGRLGADPDTRVTTSGTTIGQLRLATVLSIPDRNGQYTDRTDWHRVIVYGKRAEYIRDYSRKGHRLLICGRIQTRKWQDRDGVDQYTTEVIAEEVQILESRPSDGGNQRTSSNSSPTPTAPPANQEANDFDDDIPF